MKDLRRKKNSFLSFADARRLLFRIAIEAKRRLDMSQWPDISAKNFQELWELTRSLAALCLEQAEKAEDPKQKRMWISHGLRALRLAGKWLEQQKIDEFEAKLEEIEMRQKALEESGGSSWGCGVS